MSTKTLTKDSETKNVNGASAPKNEELTKEEYLERANRAMEKAWDLIYQGHNKDKNST